MGDVSVDDLSVEEVIPLVPGTPYPSAGRPYRIRDPLLEEWLGPVRLQARALAELQGAPALVPGPHDPAQWVFADPSRPNFASAVPDAALAAPGALVAQDAVGLFLDAGRWTNL